MDSYLEFIERYCTYGASYKIIGTAMFNVFADVYPGFAHGLQPRTFYRHLLVHAGPRGVYKKKLDQYGVYIIGMTLTANIAPFQPIRYKSLEEKRANVNAKQNERREEVKNKQQGGSDIQSGTSIRLTSVSSTGLAVQSTMPINLVPLSVLPNNDFDGGVVRLANPYHQSRTPTVSTSPSRPDKSFVEQTKIGSNLPSFPVIQAMTQEEMDAFDREYKEPGPASLKKHDDSPRKIGSQTNHPSKQIKLTIIKDLRWDGSDLGKIDSKRLTLEHVNDHGREYWRFDYGSPFIVTKHRIDGNLPLIINELKPLFGLPKLLTHRCTLSDGNSYQLNMAVVKNGVVVADRYLDDHESSLPEELTHFIQMTYVFREVVGVRNTTKRSVLLRENEGSLFPISVGEASVERSTTMVLPDTVKKRWFRSAEETEPDFDKIIARFVAVLLNISSHDQIAPKLSELRSQIEKTIMRVDKDEISLVDSIKERITTYLLREFPWRDESIS